MKLSDFVWSTAICMQILNFASTIIVMPLTNTQNIFFSLCRRVPAAAINAFELQLKQIENEQQKVMNYGADTK